MNGDDPAYHWAHVTIIRTKVDIDAKQDMMTGAKLYCMNTLSALNDAITTRRNLALNPCVNMETSLEIYDQFMAFAEKVRTRLSHQYAAQHPGPHRGT